MTPNELYAGMSYLTLASFITAIALTLAATMARKP